MTVRLSAAVALAVALLTSACSQSEPAGAPAPPPVAYSAPSSLVPSSGTSSSAASSTAAPTPATATPYITSADEAGAIAFVREYFRRLDLAANSGDVRQLAVMRTRSCRCKAIESDISTVYARGDRYSTKPLLITRLVLRSSGPAFAKLAVAFSAQSVEVRRGSVLLSTDPPVTGAYFMDLLRVGSTWLADDVRSRINNPSS